MRSREITRRHVVPGRAGLGLAVGLLGGGATAAGADDVAPGGAPRPRPLAAPTSAEIAAGQRLFAAQCTRCHGQDGSGGSGPNLRVPRLRRAPDDAALVAVIMDGVPGTAMAAAWQLSDPEVVLVAAYVRSLGRSTAGVVPGRCRLEDGRSTRGRGAAPACHILAGTGPGTGTRAEPRWGPNVAPSTCGSRSSSPPPTSPIAACPTSPPPIRPIASCAWCPSPGAPLVGFAVNEDTFTLQLRDASGAASLAAQGRPRARRDGSRARLLMPSYKDVLTDGEVQDLVAFLANLRGEP